MKKYGAIILILGIILYLSYMLFTQENIFNTGQRDQRDQHVQRAQGDQGEQLDQRDAGVEPGNQKAVEPKKMNFTGSDGGGKDVEDENYFVDDQEIFAKKSFQKKLAPLSNEEKIIWAFRLSKTTIFL
jgi:hypothetical protein